MIGHVHNPLDAAFVQGLHGLHQQHRHHLASVYQRQCDLGANRAWGVEQRVEGRIAANNGVAVMHCFASNTGCQRQPLGGQGLNQAIVALSQAVTYRNTVGFDHSHGGQRKIEIGGKRAHKFS